MPELFKTARLTAEAAFEDGPASPAPKATERPPAPKDEPTPVPFIDLVIMDDKHASVKFSVSPKKIGNAVEWVENPAPFCDVSDVDAPLGFGKTVVFDGTGYGGASGRLEYRRDDEAAFALIFAEEANPERQCDIQFKVADVLKWSKSDYTDHKDDDDLCRWFTFQRRQLRGVASFQLVIRSPDAVPAAPLPPHMRDMGLYLVNTLGSGYTITVPPKIGKKVVQWVNKPICCEDKNSWQLGVCARADFIRGGDMNIRTTFSWLRYNSSDNQEEFALTLTKDGDATTRCEMVFNVSLATSVWPPGDYSRYERYPGKSCQWFTYDASFDRRSGPILGIAPFSNGDITLASITDTDGVPQADGSPQSNSEELGETAASPMLPAALLAAAFAFAVTVAFGKRSRTPKAREVQAPGV